ncbi:MAG TPA: type II toxin-antitoxin system mRNA interferase toxin, RelE/StbE family [Candidatus Kapabacteria bacterium]|nr:type II toxin-antitoxin system mRNA interferase toxin, RelE/StbE family [Candidatus Kapabacteria bacterium]HPO62080.1 type II toxin-antitoxin system mRNA interferase toxin, RelE/StbE family [Candidatus Kapabacteria bacterium]
MNQLVWSKRFIKAVKKLAKRQPDLVDKIESTLEILEINPYEPSLRTHKLKGDLDGTLSCSVDYDYRIVFEFINIEEFNRKDILLLSIGSHDEVY